MAKRNCGCKDREIAAEINADTYINKRVVLRNNIVGKIFTRLVGDRSRYGLQTDEGELVYFYIRDVLEILP